jgi:hypothetical protein
MAEYYAVLSRAVASLEASTPEARRAVYDKARNALIGQLKAIVPPLPTSEISRQRLELEEAIRRAEREATSSAGATAPRPAARRPGPATPPPPQAQSPVPPPQAQSPEPQPQAPPPQAQPKDAPEPAPSRSPQEVFRRAIREAETRGVVPPQAVERAPVRGEALGDMAAEFHVADRPRRAPPPAEAPPYVPPEYRPARRPELEPEPRLAPDYPWEKEAPAAEPGMPRYAPTPQLGGDDRPQRIRDGRRRGGREPDRERERDNDDDFGERGAAHPSRLPTILLLVLIIGLLVALAGVGWAFRGEISKLMASLDSGSSDNSEQVASPPPPAAPAPADDAAAGKSSDRLLGGNAIATTPGVRVVGDDGDAGAPADANMPADTGSAPALATADTAQPQQPEAAPAGGQALVAQKAVLYEEPLDATKAASGVTQINAAVTWNYVNDDANGPSVVANLDVPDRGLKVKLSIRKNSDKTLPASHLIDVVITTTAAFTGKGVSSIPRLVLKPSEDARGQPLIGATAKVQEGLFWVALSALPADVDSNLALLKEQDWFDLPLVYETGQRAILTFEKGTPGAEALAQAIAAWEPVKYGPGSSHAEKGLPRGGKPAIVRPFRGVLVDELRWPKGRTLRT